LVAASVLVAAPWASFTNTYTQDLMFSAGVAIYLLVLWRMPAASPPIIAILYLIRESTLLLALPAVVILWFKQKHGLAMLTFACAVAGAAGSNYFASLGGPNIHGLPDFIYYLFKIPNNLALNVFGVTLWANTQTQFNHCLPVVKVGIPYWLPLGKIREFGYCGQSWEIPVRNCGLFLTSFGIFPTVGLFLLRSIQPRRFLSFDPVVLCAAGYGLLATGAAAVGGTAFGRYVLHAWPLFLLAIPILWVRCRRRTMSRLHLITAAMLNVVLWWLTPVVHFFTTPGHLSPWIILGFALLLQIAACRLLVSPVRQADDERAIGAR
jgi:hypothetical protein